MVLVANGENVIKALYSAHCLFLYSRCGGPKALEFGSEGVGPQLDSEPAPDSPRKLSPERQGSVAMRTKLSTRLGLHFFEVILQAFCKMGITVSPPEGCWEDGCDVNAGCVRD